MKNIKKQIKKISTIFLVMIFIAGTVFALTANEDPSNWPTLSVKTSSAIDFPVGESTTATVDANTKYLGFNIHYYAWHEGATNMMAKVDNLNGKSFKKGDSITVKGSVWADNLTTSTGYVTLNFTDDVTLRLVNTSVQRNWCQSLTCQEGTAPNAVFSGQNVGNFPVKNNSDYFGNVTVTYQIEKTIQQEEKEVVTTKKETDVTDTCATLNGYLDLKDQSSAYVKFRYGSNSNMYKTVNVGTEYSSGNFSERICGLNPNTKYYFQAYSDNSEGSIESFWTENNNITGSIDTERATNIDKYSARLNGSINNNDMNDVWFAFSRTDSTPSCNNSEQIIRARGGLNEGDNFYANIYSLEPNTKYYFKACGEDVNNNNVEGIVRNFVTDNEEKIPAEVITKNATNIKQTSAQLNGYLDVNDTENARVYFVYGKSSSNMNLETNESKIINDDTTFQSIVGLTPDTKYYFQAIVKDDNGIVDKGQIKSFWTEKSEVTITPVNGKCGTTLNTCTKGYFTNITDSATQYKWRCNGYNGGYPVICRLNKPTKTTITNNKQKTPESKPIEVVIVNEKTVETTETTKNYEEKGLKINKWVSTERFGTYGISTDAKIGDKVYYKIRIKNNSDKIIEDIEVKDFIPAELNWNGNSTENVDKYATYIVNLQPGQSKTIITEMILSDNAEIGDVIDSAAKINIDGTVEETNSVSITVVDNVNNLTNKNNERNNQTASIFGASSDLFPSTVVGWMILLILTLIVGLLITKILTFTPRRD